MTDLYWNKGKRAAPDFSVVYQQLIAGYAKATYPNND
jgi:hypothetical protein